MTSKVEKGNRIPVLISGSVRLDPILPVRERKVISTPFGDADGYRSEHCWVILRHGWENRVPPHRINHRANLYAASQVGAFVFAIGSVGSLDPDVEPGSLALPDDIFAPYSTDTISADEERIHIVPEFDSNLRKHLVSDFALAEIEVIDGGIYAQTRGPRFESKAEIAWLSEYAHFVGMTCASELTIACELQLPYALLVSVDNWGNGLGPRPLTMNEFLLGVERNHNRVCEVLEFAIPSLKRAAEMGLGSHS